MTHRKDKKTTTLLLGRPNELWNELETSLEAFEDTGLVFGGSESDEMSGQVTVPEKEHSLLMEYVHGVLHESQEKGCGVIPAHPAFPEFCGRPMLWCSTTLPAHVKLQASQLYTVDHEAIQISPPNDRPAHQAMNHAIQTHPGGGKHGPKGKGRP